MMLNFRVDPVYPFKLGIKENCIYYLDGSAVFGWIHQSAAFQLLSSAIVFIIAKVGYHVFAYIHNHILVNGLEDSKHEVR